MTEWIIVAITIFLAYAAWQQKKHDETESISSLTSRWTSSKVDWQRTLLISRGPDSAYNIASFDDTDRYRSFLRRRTEMQEILADEPFAWEDWEDLHRRHGDFKASALSIIELLSTISLLVLKGNISISNAYTIVGPQIVRNSAAIRFLIDRSVNAITSTTDETERQIVDEVRNWAEYRPGVVSRVLVLIDLLWSEAVRLRDLAPYELESAANAKRRGAGRRNRRRLTRELHVARSRVLAMWVGMILRRHLRRAEWRREIGRLRWGVGLNEEQVEKSKESWLNSVISDRMG